MSIGTIITWLIGIWRLLRGGGSSRVKVDIRSEAAIKADRDKLDKLYARMMGIDNELKETIRKLVKAKYDGDISAERRYGDKRDKLFQDFHRAKQEYDDLKRRCDKAE
jgi:hypothetical protein